jgi:hypothetical protein
MSGPGLVISNVRGPDVPLYMAGARLVTYVPVSIVVDGTGLNVTGFSYAGTMWLCAISCRDMLPDPAFFADCMRESFEEIRDAAAREAGHAARARGADERAGVAEKKTVRRRAGKARAPAAAAAVRKSGNGRVKRRGKAAVAQSARRRKGVNGRRTRAVEPQA